MKLNKAISPILATVILIAVTLVIAIGVIGWIMGIWGTFGTTETLQIMPESKLYATTTNCNVSLTVKNSGTASAVVYKVEVVGVDSATPSGGRVTIAPGATTTINASVGGTCTPGARYQVKIYTEAGNVYSVVLTAEEPPS
jgi:flagellin-like protein